MHCITFQTRLDVAVYITIHCVLIRVCLPCSGHHIGAGGGADGGEGEVSEQHGRCAAQAGALWGRQALLCVRARPRAGQRQGPLPLWQSMTTHHTTLHVYTHTDWRVSDYVNLHGLHLRRWQFVLYKSSHEVSRPTFQTLNINKNDLKCIWIFVCMCCFCTGPGLKGRGCWRYPYAEKSTETGA